MKFLGFSTLASCLMLELMPFNLLSAIEVNATISVPPNLGAVGVGNEYGAISSKLPQQPGTVRVFNSNTNQITGTLPADVTWPAGIELNGTLGIIGDLDDGAFLTFDAASRTYLGSITVGNRPVGNCFINNNQAACALDSLAQVNRIDITNPSSLTINGTIDYGAILASPLGVVVHGTTGVVCGYNSNNVVVFNADTKQIVGTISVPAPWDVATDGTTWAVSSNLNPGFVTFIDPSTLQVSGSVTGLIFPRGVSVNDQQVIVADTFNNDVKIYQSSSPYTLQSTIPVGGRPFYIASNGTTAYVTVNNASKIQIIDTAAGSIVGTVSGYTRPYGIDVDGSNMVVTQSPSLFDASLNDYVSFFDVSPGSATFAGSITLAPSSSPRLVTIQGNIGAFSNAYTNCLNVIDIENKEITGTINVPSPFGISSDGNFWVSANQGNSSLTFFDPFLNKITGNIALSNAPTGVVYTGGKGSLPLLSNNISVVDFDNMQIINTIPCGGYIGGYAASGSKFVAALTLNDELVVGDLNQGIVQLNLNMISPDSVALNKNILLVSSQKQGNIQLIDLFSLQTISSLNIDLPGGVGIVGLKGYAVDLSTSELLVFDIPAPSLYTNYNSLPANSVSSALNNMVNSGNYQQSTYDLYEGLFDVLIGKNLSQQENILASLGSQFKVIQYAQEKLDLLLHKEFDNILYADTQGTHGFVLGGYDNFAQQSRNNFVGYNVDNYYQTIGITHDWKSMKWLAAVAASESYMSVNPFASKAHYNTVWGNLGVSGKHNRWIYGLDGLFGYSFINTKRKVSVIDSVAKSSHGLWNASLDGKIGYKFTVGKVGFTGYDNLGYVYGHENDYTEHGAPGDNLAITDENISMIRNQLGMKIIGPLDKNLKVFTDLAWVYENYFGSNNYKQRFVGSTIVATVTQTVPTKNYARINAGFEGTHDRFDWRLAYTGLYGKALADSAISLKLGYKF